MSSFSLGIFRRKVQTWFETRFTALVSDLGYEGLTKLVVAPSDTDPQLYTLLTKNGLWISVYEMK